MPPLILRENDEGHLVDAQGNRYNAEGQRLDENGNVMPEPQQPAIEDRPANNGAPVQTLADFNRPDRFYANRSAIRPPAFERNDFELKLQYYTVMGQNQFHGLPSENPMDHLERFEDIVGGIKAQGVNKDYLHCKLFPHSLAGEASSWLNTLPPGSLTTWEETKKAFLVYFYDDAKSEELRTKISCFKQGPKESFKSAWIRFKKLQRDCPHHGFTETQLLSTFFKGVDWRYQVSLDSASNGNFMTRSPAAAEQLIQNLTQSNSTKQCDEQRARAGAADPQDINEIRSSLSSIQNMLKKKVSFVEEAEEFGDDQERDCNYIGGSGFQNQRSSFQGNHSGFGSNQFQRSGQNNGYTRNYGASDYQKPAPMKNDDIQGMFEQLLDGQNKLTGSLNGKIDTLYNDFNTRFEAMDNRMKKLDIQVAQTAEAVKRQTNQLPGRTEPNPRAHCNAIMTRSGKVRIETENSEFFKTQVQASIDRDLTVDRQSTPNIAKPKSQVQVSIDNLDNVDRQGATKKNSQSEASIDSAIPVDRQTTPNQKTQVRLSIDNSPNVDRQKATDRLHQVRVSIDNNSDVDRQRAKENNSQKGVSIDTTLPVDRQDPDRSLNKPVSKPRDPVPVYIPKVPYPKPSRKEIEEAKCKEVMDQLELRIPFFDACQMAPVLRRYVKKMASNEIGFDEGVKMIEETCSTMIKKMLPKKMEDPGSFVLSCIIHERVFEHSLCDSGSSVNVVPLSVAKGWGKLKPSNMMLTLADRSIRQAAGILEDVLVRVDDCLIPTDFVVLEYDEEPKDPIILGRPFLATARAMIDFAHSKVHLHLGNKVMHFDMDRKEKATIDGQTFQVNTIQEPAIGGNEVIESREEMHKSIVQSKSTTTSTEQATVVKQKAPDITLLSSPQKQRCTASSSTPTPTSKSAGKRSRPPRHRAHPGDIPRFLGRSHAPNAYTPPWMRRLKHSKHSSDPPDA